MTNICNALIAHALNASTVTRGETLQTLWSGYGEVYRVHLTGSKVPSVIVKHIAPNQHKGEHPRGWSSDEATQRKLKSYQVEQAWYDKYAAGCSESCRVPLCYTSDRHGDERWIVLEDLDHAGYAQRHVRLSPKQCQPCLSWLAHFHARFLNTVAEELWPVGTYWHLATRQREWQVCRDPELRDYAHAFDQLLNQCQYQTLVHGDAKVANFCFSVKAPKVAAVDFQYIGRGCGIRDIAYFLGSCLTDNDSHSYTSQLLDYYFGLLGEACSKRSQPIQGSEFQLIEKEWRELYPIACADFHRFLSGWSPDHQKINSYAHKQKNKALAIVRSEKYG